MNDTDPDKRLMPEEMPGDEPAIESLMDMPAASSDGDKARIGELEAEITRLKDHMMRALAETDNIRKRSVKEREDASKYSVTAFAREMIDIADNFQRAIDAVPAEAKAADPTLKNLMDGIEATERGMMRSLEKQGIKKIEPMGEPFNPNFHEVMFEAPVPGKPGGIVIQVIETGYVIHDRLLRAAKVGVSKGEDGGSHKVDETA
ncbi:MAG: grpE family protein [Micavibrio sp.]|nr:grpE family protein [Micavibrio sp.]